MVQAAVLDGLFLDLFSPFDDGGVTPVVSVGGCDVTNALMVTPVVVMIDEGADLVFEIAWQIIVLQQNAVLQGLMPTLDLALGLRVIGCATDVAHTLVLEPFGQVAGDIGRAIVAEQARLITTLARLQPDASNANVSVAVTSSAFMLVQSFQAMM